MKTRGGGRAHDKLSRDKARKPGNQKSGESLEPCETNFNVKQDGILIGLLFALAALYFLPVLAAGNSRVLSSPGTDIWNQYFYWRFFGFSALARGEIPLWNPYIFSGTPYIAGIQSAVFYPLNIVYLLFGTPFAINLSIALHCFLASLFTYLFARYLGLAPPPSLLSAITFAYGAPYFLHIYAGHLSNLSTMSWLPLLFMGVEAFLRNKKIKYAVLSGLPLSMQVFAGHPQYLFYGAIAVSVYFILRLSITERFHRWARWLGGFSLVIVSGVALSAVQLLPTLELTRYSMRESLSYEWVSIFSFPPENLITAILPDLFGDFISVPYWGRNYLWEASIYLGFVPAALAAAAVCCGGSRFVKIFCLIAVVSLLLALGKHTPLLWVFYHYVPGFDLFRGLSKFVFVISFAVSILAGFGLDALATQAQQQSLRSRRMAQGLILAAALLVALATAVSYAHGPWRQWVEAYIQSDPRDSPLPVLTDGFFASTSKIAAHTIFRASVMAALIGGLLLIFIRARKASVNFLTVPLIVLTAADLWSFGHRYLVTFDPADLRMDRELKAFLEKDPNSFRLAIPKLPDVNMGMLEGIENVGGYDAIVLRNYSELINFALGSPLDEPNIVMGISTVSPIFNLLNVRYYVVDAGRPLDDPTLALVFQGDRFKAYLNSHALPRSFIVHDAKVAGNREAALRTLASAEFNPAGSAVVAEPILNLPNDPALRSPLPKVIHHALNRVLVSADLNAPGLLILGDAYYPGWKAFVDGKESHIHRVNHVMRGVSLPAGRHTVEFRYEPFSVTAGALVSLASLFLLIIFLLWSKAEPDRQRAAVFGNL